MQIHQVIQHTSYGNIIVSFTLFCKTWKVMNCEGNEGNNPKAATKPRWVEKLVEKMNVLRRQISQICEEVRRVRKNAVLSSKLQRTESG